MVLQVLIAMVAGWMQRHQQRVITSLQEENRILTAHLDGRRLRLTDTDVFILLDSEGACASRELSKEITHA
ncbi:MAG: hypothetical protein M3361_06680 [Candidatus Tectomicrobia bacterium]|nr:hypothetical protein [Candidatus Tectomicrobia bacterium]